MKRSGMPRRKRRLESRTPLARTGKLSRSKPLRPVAKADNRKRVDGEYEPSATTVKRVLERDQRRCVVCRLYCAGDTATRGEDYHLHHRRYRSRSGHHRPSNLILLCPRDHDEVHRGDAELAERLGLAIPSPSPVQPEPVDVPVHTWRGVVLLDDRGGWKPVTS